MIERNLLLVMHAVWSMPQRGLDREDMVQFGSIGLIHAVDNYDPDNKASGWANYAMLCIRRQITKGNAQDGRTIRLPQYITAHKNKYLQARDIMEMELCEMPTTELIAEQLCLPVQTIEDFRKKTDLAVSLDDMDRDDLFGRGAGGVCCNVEREVVRKETMDELRQLVGKLKPKQAQAIRLRYGLDDGVFRKQPEVARQMGVTYQYVQSLEKAAMKRLHNLGTAGRMQDYLTA